MSDLATGRDSPKFLLRMPQDMRERIADEAKANGRSMNAEIIARLQATLESSHGPQNDELIKRTADEAAKSAVREIVDELKSTFFIRDKKAYGLILSDFKKSIENKEEEDKK